MGLGFGFGLPGLTTSYICTNINVNALVTRSNLTSRYAAFSHSTQTALLRDGLLWLFDHIPFRGVAAHLGIIWLCCTLIIVAVSLEHQNMTVYLNDVCQSYTNSMVLKICYGYHRCQLCKLANFWAENVAFLYSNKPLEIFQQTPWHGPLQNSNKLCWIQSSKDRWIGIDKLSKIYKNLV